MNQTTPGTEAGFDLDKLNSDVARVADWLETASPAVKIAFARIDALARQAAPDTTGSARGETNCTDGGKCGIGGYCKDCPYVDPSQEYEEAPQARASLAPVSAQQGAACKHEFTYFGDQPERRCVHCNKVESVAAKAPAAQAVDSRPALEAALKALGWGGTTADSRKAIDLISAVLAAHSAGAATTSNDAQPELMRGAVASVTSNADGRICVNWMRPERVEVGTLLYVSAHQAKKGTEQ